MQTEGHVVAGKSEIEIVVVRSQVRSQKPVTTDFGPCSYIETLSRQVLINGTTGMVDVNTSRLRVPEHEAVVSRYDCISLHTGCSSQQIDMNPTGISIATDVRIVRIVSEPSTDKKGISSVVKRTPVNPKSKAEDWGCGARVRIRPSASIA